MKTNLKNAFFRFLWTMNETTVLFKSCSLQLSLQSGTVSCFFLRVTASFPGTKSKALTHSTVVVSRSWPVQACESALLRFQEFSTHLLKIMWHTLNHWMWFILDYIFLRKLTLKAHHFTFPLRHVTIISRFQKGCWLHFLEKAGALNSFHFTHLCFSHSTLPL